MPYRIVYSETAGKIIRRLHPSIKPLIKQKIEDLQDDPFLGKALERELTGDYSLKSKKYRVIYRLDHSGKRIQIHYVGYRKDIYDIFRQLLKEQEGKPIPREKAIREMAGWLTPEEGEDLRKAVDIFGRKKRRSR
jgi:mRNA-degrading endonuclease RelE of RelBE toxin-antitoxin system